MRSLLVGLTVCFSCHANIDGNPVEVLDGPTFGPQRAGWVVSEIEAQNQGLSTDDRREKYAALALSPFTFFRGTNHLYWADFGQSVLLTAYGDESTQTWLQGDLHTNNLGAFSNDQGKVVYDLNDFDEAVIADYQLDVWRMATSIALVAREARLSTKQTKDAIDAFSEAYLDAMADFRGNNKETDLQLLESNTYGLLDDFLRETAKSGSRSKLLTKWTRTVQGARSFNLALENLASIDPVVFDALRVSFASYGATLSGKVAFDADFFAIKDAAKRLHAGVGSLGTPRYYVLIEGPSSSAEDDLILDVKLQPTPTAYRYLPAGPQALVDGFGGTAKRVITGQRALGYHTDDFAGWLSLPDGDYSVREVSPFKESLPVSLITSGNKLKELSAQWGLIVAAAHARADKDFSPLLVAFSVDKEIDALTNGDHAGFRALVYEIASLYAGQVAEDYQSFLAAGLLSQ